MCVLHNPITHRVSNVYLPQNGANSKLALNEIRTNEFHALITKIFTFHILFAAKEHTPAITPSPISVYLIT